MTPSQKIEEVKKLLDDPYTGLKVTSNTNKARSAILGLCEELYLQAFKEGFIDGKTDL